MSGELPAAESLDRLRDEYESWTRDWEGVETTLRRFDAFETRYAADVSGWRQGHSSPEWLHALSGWWGHPTYRTLGDRLIDISEQLVPSARESGLGDRVVYINAWTDPLIDARTTRAENGYVVLLQIPVFTMSRVAAYAMTGALGRLEPDQPMDAALWGPDRFSDEDAARFLAQGVDAYLLDAPFVAPQLEPFTDARAVVQEMMTHSAVEFVVGHELAHIASGDIDSPEARSLINAKFRPATEAEVLANMDLETKADAASLGILLDHWEHRMPDIDSALSAALVGPLTFLGFQSLVEHALATMFDYWGETHPSALLRAAALLGQIEETRGDRLAKYASAAFDWIFRLRQQVFDFLPEEHKTKEPRT